jgi:division protein CdvB (Snf7/Vps24/ESCRT-III family)
MIKNDLTEVVTLLRIHENKLENVANRFSDRGKELFEKCVLAQQQKDHGRAAIYAEEIANLRKISKVVLRSQLSLRQAALRIETLHDFKDAGAVLGPVVNLVSQIRKDLSGIVPDVANGLARVDDMLASFIVETGSVGGYSFEESVHSEEARKILQEASEISASRMRSKFPDLPEDYKHLEETPEASN